MFVFTDLLPTIQVVAEAVKIKIAKIDTDSEVTRFTTALSECRQ